jgi:hypothetical protein
MRMPKRFMLLDGVEFELSGAIPEDEVFCTLGSDGRLIMRFWVEMSDEEIVDALINLLTEISIDGALRRLGYFKRYRTVKFGDVEGSIPEILTQLSLENDLGELYAKSLGVDEDELDVLIRAVSPNVEWRKVMQGIAIRLVNQPALERIVKLPASIRDKVWDWLHNPKIVEDKNEWEQLRKPIIAVLLEITKIIVEYDRTTAKFQRRN